MTETHVDNESLGRVFTAQSSVVSNSKRLLRSESEKAVPTNDVEGDEERAISVISVSGTAQSIRKFKLEIQACTSKAFNKTFTEYMNEGKTPAAVKKEFDELGAYMSWALRSRNKKYANRGWKETTRIRRFYAKKLEIR
ncbi:unnamed protein product [Phytophthora lilii]|uniref:Unnamed protein product n=1 Tax=Phytophthora lilii TaxID=2077276 RepID=A0A9W6X933_9STRA|nr:unnamed protein product [Phytophthora lilii]